MAIRRSAIGVGLAAALVAGTADADAKDPRRRASGLELLWHVPGGSPFHRVLVVDGELVWIDAYTLERRALATGALVASLKIGESKVCVSTLAPLRALGDVIVGSPCDGDPARPSARTADMTRLVGFDPKTGAFRWTVAVGQVTGTIVEARADGLLFATLRRPSGAPPIGGLMRLSLPDGREQWRVDLDALIPWGGHARDAGRSFVFPRVDGARSEVVVAVDEASGAVLWRAPAPGAQAIVAGGGRVVVAQPDAHALLVVDAATGAQIARHVLTDMCPWTCLAVQGDTVFTLECGERRTEHFGRLVARDVASGGRRWALAGSAWEGGPAGLTDDVVMIPRDPWRTLPVDPRDGARLWPGAEFGESTIAARLDGRAVMITWFAGHLVAYRPRDAPAPAEVAVVEGVASIAGRPREGLVVRIGRTRVTTGPRGRFRARVGIDNVVRVEIDAASARRWLVPRLGRDMALFNDPVFVFRDGARRYSVELDAGGVSAAEWNRG